MRGFDLSSLNQCAFTTIPTDTAFIVQYSFCSVVTHELHKKDFYSVVSFYCI